MSVHRHIVAFGGAMLVPERSTAPEEYVVSLVDRPKARVLFLATATGDDLGLIARFYQTYARIGADPSHVPLFRRTPVDLRTLLLAQDVIHVGGGNTFSMLAVWRSWGIDEILREAWDRGIVLTGSSAGAICWFDQGVTDSWAESLRPMRCLGFARGSFCPHYDGEPQRRPSYQALLASGGIADGFAADDAAGVHYLDDAPYAFLAATPTARAYRVERMGDVAAETPLEMTRI